jgi:hypothetical protein
MARTYDWTAPAKLFFWPADNGADEEVVYPTLASALRAAAEGDAASAWIITQEGDILNPKMIDEIRLDLKPVRRVGLFGRSWTARAGL